VVKRVQSGPKPVAAEKNNRHGGNEKNCGRKTVCLKQLKICSEQKTISLEQNWLGLLPARCAGRRYVEWVKLIV